VPLHPTADESRDRLHRAGWSIGDVGTAGDMDPNEMGQAERAWELNGQAVAFDLTAGCWRAAVPTAR
jgi:hypothetical protein